MPIELTNFTVWGRQWFADGWEGLRRFCDECGLSGIELLASGATLGSAPPHDLIRGIHLRSLGSWLPLIGIDVSDFGAGSNRYAGCETYAQLVDTRADELRQAAVFQPDYVVWHGMYAPFPLLAGGRWRLTPGQFLKPLARLVRDVCSACGSPPFKVLLENAFGVGVGPAALDETVAFLDELSDLPLGVGLVLDIGHHLNTRRDIASASEACRELHRLADEWHRRGIATDALHLHWTPPAEAAEGIHEDLAHLFETVSAQGRHCNAEREAVASRYFERSDRHFPLADPALADAVRALSPSYVVHEMGALSLEDHRTWLAHQAAAMRGGS